MYLTGGRSTYIIKILGTAVMLFMTYGLASAKQNNPYSALNPPPDTSSAGLRYSFSDEPVYSSGYQESPLYLSKPSNVTTQVEYDPVSKRYIVSEKIGDMDYKPPISMSADEYNDYHKRELVNQYWVQKRNEESGMGPSFMRDIRFGGEAMKTVFGTDAINIKPRGSAELIFGYSLSRTDNPNLPIKNRRTGSFTFKEKINMDVTGTIGDKMELGLNYNTEASFNFENKTKLEYTGKEDEIIKKIEAGDVTFSLPGSLITGSQSLFGLKTELQFGKLTVTTVLSHQRGESSSIEVQGGAQLTEFEIEVDEYDENRHFFLTHFFRDNYNNWLKNLPHIESQMQIQQIEVWAVNKQNDFTEARNVVAVMDLAEGYGADNEPNFYADNALVLANQGETNQPGNNLLNRLYQRLISQPGIRRLSTVDNAISSATGGYDFESGRDYVILESARPLSDREFTVNRELGYISLNSPLRNDEVLAVAFVYTYRGKTYKVGELASESSHPDVLILKLIKGITQTPKYPTWDLMMKNVYSIGAFQVSREGFILDVFYRNDKTGKPVNYLTEPANAMSEEVNEKILLKVMELDNLDSRNEPNPDGLFDYIEGVTINSRNGRVFFPLVEPFGKDLREKIVGSQPTVLREQTADKYVFEELYDSTHTKAQQIAEKNKFVLRGRYQSASSSDIQLNAMNIPQGSVKVTAGGIQLVENQDYTVDYTLGRVKILNQGLLESGTPIRISLESNSLFNLQTKTLLGTHLDYRFSDNFNVGATIINLTERPITEKSNIGDVPISNTIWGLNTSYRTESQLLTSLVDKLPLIETKEVSNIALDAEFAHLIPGQAHTENNAGVAFIDDFEGAQTKIELKNVTAWKLASAPQGQPSLFPYAAQDGRLSGYGRAKLAWYIIDPLFTSQQSKSLRPDGIDTENHYVRRVDEKELFPQRDASYGLEPTISVLNLAYYPEERGPYNFDPGLSDDGRLPNPDSRWGGIMREIQTSDFETSNVEFIEFWMMDPYIYNADHEGGDLIIQLGEVSEDILRDSRKSYEDGLPGVNEEGQLDSTEWGRIPRGTSLVNAFDTDPDNRIAQDVGLDGLNDDDEQTYFGEYLSSLSPAARSRVIDDPSGDNFKYYLGEEIYPVSSTSILYRYKNYNGMEGNSPAITDPNAKYIPSNQTIPDVEDINRDNTLNTTETYFQYRVSLRPEDLMMVGDNFITDKVEVGGSDGTNDSVKWYQFRIPIGAFESKIGQIEDFKSIRFMRVILNDFADSVVLRFATLELVRGEWRRYNFDFNDAGPSITQQHDGTDFEISAVNIEENITKTPVNYILPPGVNRDTDPSQQTTVYLNEQSLLLKVRDLQDYDARTVFKNTQLDLRQYKNLKMFIHAEAVGNEDLEDYELTAFIRLGSDYKDNYYEYEVPLKVTPARVYNQNSEGDKYIVWPAVNFVDLSLDELVELKGERNVAIQNDPVRYSTQKVYRRVVEKVSDSPEDQNAPPNVIKVKGNPNLENVRQIMIGIRNPGDGTSAVINDGLPKSGEVWFNELRLTDFNNKGGWAANGRVQATLADFGIVKMAGSTSKPGFGSVDQTVEQRSKEEINQYDISTNLELGKFFPEKANVSVPMYVGVSKSVINPEYYPGDPDVKFKDVLKDASSKSEKDSLKKISQDLTRRSSINFTNVRWNKEFKKFKPLSPGNFTFGAGHSLTQSHNYNVEYNNFRRYNATFDYNLNLRPKPVQPFRKSKKLRKPYLRIIRDFNFNYYPSRFTFSTQFDRNYQEMKMRNVFTDVELRIDSTVNKDFTWNRIYNLKWDFTRSLKFDYSAQNYARIDEPAGAYDLFKPDNERWKDSVWNNILNGGRNMQFNQSVNLQYTLPINKIPMLNWISMSTSYNGTFNWLRGDVLADKERNLGNTIKNSNSVKMSTNLNMKNLFYKWNYLKQLDQKYSGRKKKDEDKRYKTVEFSKKTFFKKEVPKNIFHRLGTDDVVVKVYDKSNTEIEADVDVINENKVAITVPEDITGAEVRIEGKIERGEHPLVYIGENSIRFITGIKTVSISWTKTHGTMLPGYLPGTNYFGLNNEEYAGAPGVPYVLGWTDNSFAKEAALKGWLTTDSTFSRPALMTMSEQLNLRTSFEPFKGFRIDLTAFRSYSETAEQIYYYDEVNGNYGNHYFDNEYLGGNFSISVITIGTAFEKVNADNNWRSDAFEEFKENRKIISARRHSLKTGEDYYYSSLMQPAEEGYYDGYGSTSSEVLIPAFLAAYTQRNPRKITLEPFPWNMMPNWRITINKLDDIKALKKIFKSITLSHSYKSTYSIGSFSSNLAYFGEDGEGVRGFLRDNQMNFIPQYQIFSATINEQLSPLMSIDMTWQNSMLTKFELRKSRILSLSLNNNQLTETRNNDIVIGAGYRFKEVALPIEGRDISSDLDVRFDFSIRDNVTIIRSLARSPEDEREEPTTGDKRFTISLTADYVISNSLNIQLYFDRNVRTPYTSRSFLTAETNIGFSLRFSL